MSEDIGAKISLQGEREFRNAINEINSGLKVTASELTLVTAKFSDNATGIDALTAKNQVLENRLNSQRDKVEKLREALTNAAQKYGEADRRTMNWQVSLNKAEAELVGMEKDLKKNQEEIKNFGKETESFGDKINSLASSLGINLPAGAQQAIKSLDGQKMSTLALIGATTALITGLSKLTVETAKNADEILTLSKVTGLSTDTIQEMNYASELVDVSAETTTGSMRKMIKSMAAAKDGSKDTQQAFKELHLSITNNGKLKDSEQMFYEIIDALGKVSNETEKDALAMKIFGKSAQELNPLIDVGSKTLKEFGDQAQKMGYVMDSNTLDSFGKLDDKMQIFNNQTKAFKDSIALAMLPVLTALFEILNKMNPKVLATVTIIGSIAIVAITVVKSIADITSTFSAMTPITLKTTMIILGVVAALIALAAIIAVITGRGDDLNRTMNSVGNSVSNMTSTVNGAGSRIGHNASGTDNWRGGLTWVNEEGGEIVDLPRGTRIIPHDVSMQMARNGSSGGGDTYNFNVNMSDIDDLIKFKNLITGIKQSKRAGVVTG